MTARQFIVTMFNVGYLLALENAKSFFTVTAPEIKADRQGNPAFYFEVVSKLRSQEYRPPALLRYPSCDYLKIEDVQRRQIASHKLLMASPLLEKLVSQQQRENYDSYKQDRLLAYAYKCLEDTFETTISNCVFEKQAGRVFNLSYTLGQRVVESSYELDDVSKLLEFYLSAKSIRDGYDVLETVGQTLQIRTPSGLIRAVDGLNSCNCKEFNLTLLRNKLIGIKIA